MCSRSRPMTFHPAPLSLPPKSGSIRNPAMVCCRMVSKKLWAPGLARKGRWGDGAFSSKECKTSSCCWGVKEDEVLHSLDENAPSPHRPFRASPGAQSFFETMRQHTIAGFLIDPDFGGNDSGAGWKVIGREREHMFQAPFGFYDRDYAGWQPMPKEADKK